MSDKKVVVSDLTDRELEVAWHAICAFAEWTYEFPFPAKVEGLDDQQLKLYNEGAQSRHEVFEIVADVLMQRMAEDRSISRKDQST